VRHRFDVLLFEEAADIRSTSHSKGRLLYRGHDLYEVKYISHGEAWTHVYLHKKKKREDA
jgi:hypothetical protein